MQDFILFIKEKKNLANLLVLLIMVLAIPLGVNVLKDRQIFFTGAAVEPIDFGDGRCIEVRDGQKVLKCGEIPLKLTAPKGQVPPPNTAVTYSSAQLAQVKGLTSQVFAAENVLPPEDADLQFRCVNGSPMATVSWDKSVSGDIERYQIDKKEGSGSYRRLNEVPGSQRREDDTNITSDRNYRYRIRAVRNDAYSDWNETPTKTSPACSNPTPNPTPQPTQNPTPTPPPVVPPPVSSGGFESAVTTSNNCGLVDSSRVSAGALSGQIFYTSPTLRDSNLVRCAVKITLTNTSSCDFQIKGKGESESNALGSNETVEIDFGRGDRNCEVPLFVKNPNTQPPQGGPTNPPPRITICSVNASTVVKGFPVTYRVDAENGVRPYTISWQGDGGSAETNQDNTLTVTYNSSGVKNVQTRVRDSVKQDSGLAECPQVTVTDSVTPSPTPPPTAPPAGNTGLPLKFLSCRGSVTNGATGDIVTWRADAESGTRFGDNKYQISWEGEGLIGEREGHTDFITAQYLTAGAKTAKVRITDAANGDTGVKDCGPVEVVNPLLRVSCVPSATRILVGTPIKYRADAEGGTRPYRLSWDGDQPLDKSSTADSLDVTYTTPGVKKAFVTVEDSAQHQIRAQSCGEVTVEELPLLVTGYSVAGSLADLEKATVTKYTSAPTTVNYELTDLTPGVKQVYVRYFYSKGNPETYSKNITLVGPDPSVQTMVCRLDLSKENVVMTITGSQFGTQKGRIAIADFPGSVNVTDWKNDQISAVLNGVSTQNQSFNTTITRADGRTVSSSCSIGVAQISLGAKLFCREEGKHDQSNVSATLIDDSGKKIVETVTIDKNGVIQGLKTKLQNDRQYVISIESPKGLRRNAIFKASEGTAVATSLTGGVLTLPVGDIYPSAGDGIINTLDKSELNRQWRVLGASSKELSGDFNIDGKVNAFDWACMRYDFDEKDEPVPSRAPDSGRCQAAPVCTPPSTLITGDPNPSDPDRCPRFSCSQPPATSSARPSSSP